MAVANLYLFGCNSLVIDLLTICIILCITMLSTVSVITADLHVPRQSHSLSEISNLRPFSSFKLLIVYFIDICLLYLHPYLFLLFLFWLFVIYSFISHFILTNFIAASWVCCCYQESSGI